MTSQGMPETLLIYGEAYRCPGCGCYLSAYEVFAQRIRGIKKPWCLGCLASTVRDVKRFLVPIVEGLLQKVEES